MTLYDQVLKEEAIPRFYGIQAGIVRENYDEEHKGMIQVEIFYGEEGKTKTFWIRVATPYAAAQGGAYALPEVGTEVLVAYLDQNPDEPVVIGSLWNDTMATQESYPTEKNITKAFRTKAGNEILFSDEQDKEKITIRTAGKMELVFDDENAIAQISNDKGKNYLSIDFQNGSCILEGEKGLSFQIDGKELISLTSSGVEIKADQITVDASNSLTLKGGTAKIEANTLSMEAKSECKVKANASLKLESSGIAALKGSMTQIN